MLVALVSRQVGARWLVGLMATLAFAGLSLLQLATTVRDTKAFGCEPGVDFVALLSGAHLLGSRRFYDIDAQGLVKEEIFASIEGHKQCRTTAMEYLAVFVVPLLALTKLPPLTAFYAWTALNIGLIAFSLHRLAQAASLSTAMLWLWALGFFPIVFGLALGQVTGLLLLNVTEAYLALRRGQERRAGLWLSLLLVKLQFVPLLVLMLLWKRRRELLVSFGVGTFVLIGLSLALVGVSGARDWVELTAGVGQIGADASAPIIMANWRSVSIRFLAPFGSTAMLFGLILLTLLTIFTSLLPWRGIKWDRRVPDNFDIGMLSLMAGALLVGYSTHLPSVVLLVPSAVFLAAQAVRDNNRFVLGALDLFAFGPSLLFQAGVLSGIGAAYPIPSLGTVATLCILSVMALARRRLGLGGIPVKLSESSKVFS